MKDNWVVVEINNLNYKWRVSRQPQWCHEDRWQGVQLSVESIKEHQKVLLIQLSFEILSRRSTPQKQRPKIQSKEVVEY